MKKKDILDLLDKEIRLAKGFNLPLIVMGMQQAKKIIEVAFSKDDEIKQ